MCFMASAKVVWLDAESTSLFRMPPCLSPGIAGEPRDIGVPWLDPQPDPSACDNPTSIGEPGGRPSSSQSSCLVTGEATPLVRLPMPESLKPPEVGRWMGGMVAVSSPYAGGVCGPGVSDAFLDCRGLYTSSEPNSLLIIVSHPAAPISFGVWPGDIGARSLVLGLTVPEWILGVISRGCLNARNFCLLLPLFSCQLSL